MSSDATNIEEHLRAASDAILLLLTEIGQLERHKRGIPPGEPRFDEVARSVRVAAQALAEFTEYEESWARIATDGRTDIEPISESENAPAAAVILERWRAIERQLDDMEPGSPEAARLFAEFERAMIQERVRAGLRNARAKGRRLGRPRVIVDASRIALLRSQGHSWAEIGAETGISKGTAQRAVVGLPKSG